MDDAILTSMSRIEKVEYLQNLLLARATHQHNEQDNAAYRLLRRDLLSDVSVKELLPRFVSTCASLGQFWSYIKPKFSKYQQRREFIWEQFRPLIGNLEGVENAVAPHDESVTSVISEFDTEHVLQAWQKALERRHADPEAALTSARTVLESVCKHVLDDAGVEYDDKADLPKLYGSTAKLLNMSPAQHQEQIFKQILGGCHSVVQGLGAMRNQLSDAHGRGEGAARPQARHAALGVNLAGAMSEFIIATWTNQDSSE